MEPGTSKFAKGFEGPGDWGSVLGEIGTVFIIFKGISFYSHIINMKDLGWLLSP